MASKTGTDLRTAEELEAEIARLQKENERLRAQSSLTLMGTIAVAPRNKSFTIAGLEELILQVGTDDTVGYVNTPMARLLEIPDRKAALGTALDDWDHGPLGERALGSLVQLARGSAEAKTLERPCPDLSPELLPGASEGRPAGDPILSFVASSAEGRVQIIAQDVTKLRWLEATFSRFVSPKVIQRMEHMPVDDFLSMERRELSVLFCDLRGFTALCQQATPEQVQETVNSFLCNMVRCIEQLDGTVQGFAGDEVMALFGAPVPQPDHALRALICAVQMQQAHGAWIEQRTANKLPTRLAGIGLASGSVVVGNIGTPSLMTYTAQGHTTNLAARLCGAAAGGEVLTVPATHSKALEAVKTYQGELPVPRFRFEPKGQMAFKNVDKPVQVLAVSTKR